MQPSVLRFASIAAIAAALLAAPVLAPAADYQTVNCEIVRTVNATQSRVWVTIYDLLKTRHLDYGWVEACSFRDWKAGSYACGSYYNVRGEVKNYAQNANVYDTTMQIHPMTSATSFGLGAANPTNVVTLRKGQGNYYWAQGATISDTDGKVQGCDLTPPQGAPIVSLEIYNVVGTAVNVNVIAARTGQSLVANECIESSARKAWTFSELQYKVHADALTGRCGTAPAGDSTDVIAAASPGAARVGVQLLRQMSGKQMLY